MNPFDVFGTWLGEVVQWALDLVQAVGPVWGTVIAGLAILCECTLFLGILVPGDTLVIAAATGVRSPLHCIVLVVTVIVATLAGQSLGYLLGRWAGPAIRRSRLGRRFGNGWDRAAAFVTRRGGWAVLISRFLPVLHALMPVTVGMSRMPYRRFIRWAVPAAVIWSILYVGVGTAAAGSFRALEGQLHIAGYLFAAILVLAVVVGLIGKRWLSHATAVDTAPETTAAEVIPISSSSEGPDEDPGATGRMEDDEPAA